MNLLVLVLCAHNIYLSTHICILWCDIKKNYIIEGNLLQKHFRFKCRSFGAGQCIIAHVLIVWLFSQHGWGLHLCCSSWEKSADGTMPPPGSLNSLEPAQRLTKRAQIMITPWCCLHIPPSLDDTSAVQQQLTTKARWRQILVLDPLEWPESLLPLMGWSTLTANSYNIYTIWTPPEKSTPDNAAARITGYQGQKSNLSTKFKILSSLPNSCW